MIPCRFLDEAREHAKCLRAEAREHPGWLAGLPIAVKEAGKYDVEVKLVSAEGEVVAQGHVTGEKKPMLGKQTPDELVRQPFTRRVNELRDRIERPQDYGQPSAAEWELAMSLLLSLCEKEVCQ